MVKLRGFVGIVGILALAVSLAVSEHHVLAQRGGEPSLQLLDERGRENRQRIVHLESTEASVASRLTRIETELEIARRVSEANGQLMAGLLVGMVLILFERAMVFFSYMKRSRGSSADHG